MSAKKLAIFVEGQTEAIFLDKLVTEVGGFGRLVISHQRVRNLTTIHIRDTAAKPASYAVLIVNCEHDETVKSRILENRSCLISAGYNLVLGVRDVFPADRADLPVIQRHLKTRVPTKGIPIEICLSIMEVESWFLFDETHYSKIDASLTLALIAATFRFDPANDNPEDIDHPSALLRDIYRMAGKSYTKKKNQVSRTVGLLDYPHLYMNARATMPQTGVLLDHLDGFFT